ncbi:MAG: class I SAM-dependent methyltransferase [Solirubrobacterales bacterium]
MVNFWDSAVLPLLRAAAPTSLAEVGAASGSQTRKLISWATEHQATFHAIDPAPAFDVDAFTRMSNGHFVMHREPSLSALRTLGPVDVVLLDGDHNWYTVFNELKTIETVNPTWPLVLTHDIDWPYGRRDMYYAPATIPATHRHAHRKSGLRRFHSSLVEDGKNAAFFNAEHEGGPRNGVLTAIEDFLASTPLDLIFLAQPGPAGLGILAAATTIQGNPELAAALAQVHDPVYATSIAPVYATRELDHEALRRAA